MTKRNEEFYKLIDKRNKYADLLMEAQTKEDIKKYRLMLDKVHQNLDQFMLEFGVPGKYDLNKVIVVDGECKINRDNPTLVKHQNIAINIEALNSKKGFKNFVLGIDTDEYGVFGTLGSKIPKKMYVKTIKRVKLDDKQLDDLKVTGGNSKFNNYSEIDENSEVLIFEIKDSANNKYYAGVFNCDHEKYPHAIYENGSEITFL